jgi:uncharacterized protein YwlG (UPF0340 family)
VTSAFFAIAYVGGISIPVIAVLLHLGNATRTVRHRRPRLRRRARAHRAAA